VYFGDGIIVTTMVIMNFGDLEMVHHHHQKYKIFNVAVHYSIVMLSIMNTAIPCLSKGYWNKSVYDVWSIGTNIIIVKCIGNNW